MSYEIRQGILTEYTAPRVCNVIQIPNNYLITGVRLPHVFSNQTRPLKGSLVLLFSQDSFQAYILAVIREPVQGFGGREVEETFKSDSQMRGATNDLSPGEVFIQAIGSSNNDPTDNAYLYIGNNGSVELASGSQEECIIVGGETSDEEDHEIILRAANVFIESSVNQGLNLQSSFEFKDNNDIRVGNSTVTIIAGVKTEVPNAELTIDNLNNITLRNTVAGIDNGKLAIDTSGGITLSNPIGSLKITSLGNVIMNNGVLGVARLTDLVTSDITTDPAWWTFWTNLSLLITALPVTPLDGGATFKTGLAALFAIIPLTTISRITSASSTVRAG